MAKTFCHYCTTQSTNVYHEGKCPMAKNSSPKTKHGKATKRITGLNTRIAETRVKLREAEDLLSTEEDRETRRSARRRAGAVGR